MQYITEIIIGMLGLGLGFAIGAIFLLRNARISEKDFENKKNEILRDADAKAEELKNRARSQINDIKKQAQDNNRRIEMQLKHVEESMSLKEKQLERRRLRNEDLVERIRKEEESAANIKKETEGLTDKTEKKLIEIAKIGAEVLKEQLLSKNANDLDKETKERIEILERRMGDEAPRRAKETIKQAVYTYGKETSVDRRERNIVVPNDNKKIELVGRNAVNIKTLEELLPEVSIVFNDAPDTISVYSFDLIKEHIVILAIEKLMKEPVITPEKIKSIVASLVKQMPKVFEQIGRKANERLKLENPNSELLSLIGRLHFRTSYGQNILKHSFEVASMARFVAYEIGANVRTAWLAAFFHDIGKAIDKEVEGVGHDVLTKEILEKYKFPEDIIHAAWVHHEAAPAKTIEAKIVQASDAISASRPGARSESLEQYLERIRLLEDTAASFSGISKAHAMSSGREVRLFVNPAEISDQEVKPLAMKIAQRVENKLTYPGTIRINVIRKTQSTSTASSSRQ